MATVKTVKKTEPRFDVPVISNLGIQSYGHNNLYPQEIVAIVAASESASSCIDRYKSFIQGNGFKDIPFSETVLNAAGETADDILQLLASDMANFRGIALHVNYNVFGQIVELSHIPFENARLCEPDSEGYIGQIAIHPDWTGKTKRAGKYIKVGKENIDYIDVFNPRKEVVLAQIEAAENIENYKGQTLWLSEEGKQTYPKPVHDSVVSYMSTEEGLGNILNRNSRNGLFPASVFITRKGQDTAENESEQDDTSIADSINKAQGDINTGKVMHIEIEHDEEMPKFERIQSANYDKEFTVTTETASQKIYAAFNQEIWNRIMKGSIGFSSEILRDAYEYYSTVTSKERRMIERAFNSIFKHWYAAINTSDFTIQPLVFVPSETNVDTLIKLYEKDMVKLNDILSKTGLPEKQDGDKYLSDIESTPLAVKLGVGGTQALQSILSDPNMSNEQKTGSLEELFGLDQESAQKLVYGKSFNNAG
ncbi:MAG: hypothetical protein LBP72_08065 [Dysgonamonadaceae bacterium]|jgi:hypothetical protein|nr:hypothetical protein [Dysgonamonadaceae bacterium]